MSLMPSALPEPENYVKHSPKPSETAQKTMILHNFGAQVNPNPRTPQGLSNPCFSCFALNPKFTPKPYKPDILNPKP